MANQNPEIADRSIQETGAKSGLSFLIAYDGSEHARAAVELLLELAEKNDIPAGRCALTLISVLPTQWIGSHEQVEGVLKEEEKRLNASGYSTQMILKAGNPAATINDYAQEHQADLIVVGAKGRRATLGILLGGVAQQVVEYSNSPVLVVRAPYHGLRRILVVVDGSESSRKAVNYLVPICPDGSREHCAWLPVDSQVDRMHVLPPSIVNETTMRAWALGPEAIYPTPLPPIDSGALEASELKFGERLLSETERVLGMGGLKGESILVRGDAASEILSKIETEQIDMVVCGSRGLSAISSWLLGSVSRKLVHYASCSVLIVK
jgi:nucleotide-binding universal stress UspA family protein